MDKTRYRLHRAQSAFVSELGADIELALPVARDFAILTCMDARIDPTKLAPREGDAHIIRNAGGRANDDVIHSLVMSYEVLGAREWFIVHHTQCGMALLSDQMSRDLLVESLKLGRSKGSDWRDRLGRPASMMLAIQDPWHSLVEDLERIRNHPLVPADVEIHGYMYQLETGELVEVHEGTQRWTNEPLSQVASGSAQRC
jgi:carbonic anhydrase